MSKVQAKILAMVVILGGGFLVGFASPVFGLQCQDSRYFLVLLGGIAGFLLGRVYFGK